jgi:hypothetical protein
MKRVLVVYFSQTGQLRRVAESVCAPLQSDAVVHLDWLALESAQPYPFPWPLLDFFDQFPEAVHLQPPALKPWSVPGETYDLVILAFPVWFLSPAPPITAFLKSEAGRRLLHEKPVITLIACRNMWLMAQETVKGLLAEAGAKLSDHIALVERGNELSSFITTPRWLLTGRTDVFWGLQPPGIAASEIAAASRFGRAIATALHEERLDGSHPVLTGLEAVKVDDRLIASERIGQRSFRLWGRLLRALGPQGSAIRRPALLLYMGVLILLIVTVVPASLLLRRLLNPIMARRLAQARAAFEQPSGSAACRLAEFGS